MGRGILLAIIGAILSAPALAGVQLKEVNTDPGLLITVSSTGYDGKTWAGIYNLDIINSTIPGLEGLTESFCIDIWDVNPTNYEDYTAVSLSNAPDPGAGPMGATKASQLAALLNAWWNDDLDTDEEAAALQMAVWEVVDEGSEAAGDYDVTDGDFKVTAAAGYDAGELEDLLDLANDMLGSTTNGADISSYLALTNDTEHNINASGEYASLGKYQDYVVKVPVPAAFVLGLLGMSVAGLKLRKHT